MHDAKRSLKKRSLPNSPRTSIDVTLPGRMDTKGGIHPVMRTWMRIEEIFRSIGFDVADGPEIESDWFSFTALNTAIIARSMQDTFYVDRNDDEGRPLPLPSAHLAHARSRYASYASRRRSRSLVRAVPIA